jgi:hypothetical protein
VVRAAVHSRREGGLTLLEILLVLGVLSVLMILLVGGVRRITEADLREQSAEIASVLRFAHAAATQTGQHHRVVFDLDEQTFRVEMCEEVVRLRKVDAGKSGETDAETVARLLERPPTSDQVRELLEAVSPEEMLDQAAALEGVQLGGARCRVSEDWNADARGRGNQRQIRADDGLRVRAIHAQHLRSEARTGTVSLSFFPLGHAEKAVVEVADHRGGEYYLLLHRLSGRVELVKGRFDPDDHMRRDGAGDRVARDR